MRVDLDRISSARQNRRSRIGRPFDQFRATYVECLEAADLLLSNEPLKHRGLLERSVIISAVTAIEVYYKDMLALAFLYCSPEYIEKIAPQVHTEKYTILQLMQINKNSISPVDLIVKDVSFQNCDSIERVFSKLIGRGFWSDVTKREFPFKDGPVKLTQAAPRMVENMSGLFQLRHEMIHDLSGRHSFEREHMVYLWGSLPAVIGSDLALSEALEANKAVECAGDA